MSERNFFLLKGKYLQLQLTFRRGFFFFSVEWESLPCYVYLMLIKFNGDEVKKKIITYYMLQKLLYETLDLLTLYRHFTGSKSKPFSFHVYFVSVQWDSKQLEISCVVLCIRIKHGSFEEGSKNIETEIDHSSFLVKDYVFQLC